MELQKIWKIESHSLNESQELVNKEMVNLATECIFRNGFETEQTSFEYRLCFRFLTPPVSCRRILMLLESSKSSEKGDRGL